MVEHKEIDPLVFIDAFTNDTRSTIFFYLQIYNELTLEDLCKLVGKSKTAIHHHIQILLNLGVISETTKPGSKTRYYKLEVIRLDKATSDAFNLAKFNELSTKEQLEAWTTLVKLGTSLLIIGGKVIAQTIKFREEAIKPEFLEDKNFTKFFSDLSDNSWMAIYNASLENAQNFIQDLRKLVISYYDKESANQDNKRPFTFVLSGTNLEFLLEHKE